MRSGPPEVTGLLALLLLHDARRDARSDADGNIILLEDQDRSGWNREQILEALALAADAMQCGASPCAVQAAIAAAHCRAEDAQDMDWQQIVRIYKALERLQPSPMVSLNRAVAVATTEGPERGHRLVEWPARRQEAGCGYHLLHATRAEFLRRLGANAKAVESYRRALSLATNTNEIRFLKGRLNTVEGVRIPLQSRLTQR